MDVAVVKKRTKKRKPASTIEELRLEVGMDIAAKVSHFLVRGVLISSLKKMKWFEYNDKYYPRPREDETRLSERYYLPMKNGTMPQVGCEYMIGIARECCPEKIVSLPATICEVNGKPFKCCLVKIKTTREIKDELHPFLRDILKEEYILFYHYTLNIKAALKDAMEPPDPTMNFRGGPAYLNGQSRWNERCYLNDKR